MSALITLTTDFGWRDPYVAAMKGVLLSLCPDAVVTDLSHDISAHNVLEAALFVSGSAPYFPAGSVHVAVVDPGVGTDRLPIAVAAEGIFFVCPDNGILTLYLRQHVCGEVRVISNPDFMLKNVSSTFHGRDIFAPAAARLACGFAFEDIGAITTDMVRLPVPSAGRISRDKIAGQIIHTDRFGNLTTNIPRSMTRSDGADSGAVVEAGQGRVRLNRLRHAYGEVACGKPLALWGSSGYLEIAVNQGSAALELELTVDDQVSLRIEGNSHSD